MTREPDYLEQPVSAVARKDVATVRHDFTVQQALDAIRQRGIGEKIVYFYAVDSEEHLVGVLPTRRLLSAPLEQRVSEMMVSRVAAIPQTATVLEACEAFLLHKFLAFPVVDDEQRVVGVVDIGLLTEEAFDIAERRVTDELFERIGFRVASVRDASPVRAFRFRFPWLLATIGSGLICALLASAYEVTITKSIVLAFFMTLVLGLGESVSIQSLTVTIHALGASKPTIGWYVRAFRREVGTAVLLGIACGTVVGIIVWLWHGTALAGFAIGASIQLVLCGACFLGLSVPALLHALKLDPKIAAGPVTLAATDIFTLLCYFSVATWVL